MKYAKYSLVALCVVFAILLPRLAPKSATVSDFLLDTYISITAYGPGAKKAVDKAIEHVRTLDKTLSAFHPESDVYKINYAGKNNPTTVSRACFYVIEQALWLSDKTGGAFDITVKPVMDLWGFGTEKKSVPTDKALQDALSKVDYRAVALDKENQTVTLLKQGASIDLGGIAKGYCADEAMRVLKENGIQNAYLDFGGNIVTMGQHPLEFLDRIKNKSKTRPFVVGIQDPKAPKGTVLKTYTAMSNPCTIVTSGGYERNFTENGVVYHHILDPKTGMQPQNNLASVTVIGTSSLVCDALSTALFVKGPENVHMAKELCESVLFITDKGEEINLYP